MAVNEWCNAPRCNGRSSVTLVDVSVNKRTRRFEFLQNSSSEAFRRRFAPPSRRLDLF